MANTSLADFTKALDGILAFNNGSGSVNLYMAHGGTNFGYTAGALDVLCDKIQRVIVLAECGGRDALLGCRGTALTRQARSGTAAPASRAVAALSMKQFVQRTMLLRCMWA